MLVGIGAVSDGCEVRFSEGIMLEGEQAQLEPAWREAEEVAAIADNPVLREHSDEFLDRHSRRRKSGGP